MKKRIIGFALGATLLALSFPSAAQQATKAKALQIEPTPLPQLTTRLGCLIRALHFKNMSHPVSAVVL